MCSLFESTHVDHENMLDKARKLADCLQYSYVQLIIIYCFLTNLHHTGEHAVDD